MGVKQFIETRATSFNDRTPEAHQARVQHFLAGHRLPMIADWTPRGKVEAYVNEGRWIAECPEEYCNGAEFVDPDWPVMVCSGGCGSGPFGVVFPKERENLTAVLVRRPVPATRNWAPGETVLGLKAENAVMLDGLIDRIVIGISGGSI